jgi:hypothetical protein
MLQDNIQKTLAPLNLEQGGGGRLCQNALSPGSGRRPGTDAGGGPGHALVGLLPGVLHRGWTYPEHFTVVYHFANFQELCRTAVHVVPLDQERP